ncbi:MAG: HTH luxR-type domain-containing protein [Nitrospira sp.]|nr:MAG: HTH luxR-type domain-containing protein [Nitrospira sp.]
MEHLTSHDCRRVLRFLHQLYEVRPHAEFITDLVAALPTVIATDVSSYNEVDSAQRFAAYLGWPPDHPDIPDAQEILGRYAHQSPLVTFAERATTIEAHKMTDFVTQRSFRATDLFNEFYRPLQLPYNMGVKLTRSADPLIAVSLLRSRRDFSSRDIALLDVLSPHLVQAYRNATAVTRLHCRLDVGHHALAVHHEGLVSITRDRRICFSTPLGERLMARYDNDPARDQNHLPPRLARWVRRELAHRHTEDFLHRPSLAFRITGSSGVLTARLVQHHEQFLILLEETPHTSTHRYCAMWGLTARESEILEWVVQGKTNPEIGMILGISHRTVQKHLERIYIRLGVENRHAAMAVALEVLQRDRNGKSYD